MNSAKYVDDLIVTLKNQGVPLSDVAWKAALACVGWPYVYGAVGEECKPAKRRQYGAKFYLKDHTTIVTKCKALSWNSGSQTCEITGNCTGCKWNLPTRMFDCRGFTRKILQMVYGWTLVGGTVAGQWNESKNWKAKGEIATMPRDTLCCLFVYNSSKKKWMHTGFGFNDETVEASNGVQHFTKRNSKWTHWAVPACTDQTVAPSSPVQPATDTNIKLPTLRRGSKGSYVTLLQTALLNKGYKLPKYGADGSFGEETEKAVKQFQADNGLNADGVVGNLTWQALEKESVQKKLYTVTIQHLDKDAANEIITKYSGVMTIEE